MELDYQTTPGANIIGDGVASPSSPYQQQQQLTSPQQQQQLVPQQQQQQRVLGLVIPGRPVRTDFVPADPSGTKFAMTLTSPGDLPSPLTLVPEIVCYLEAPLPPGFGVSIYWQLSLQEQQSGFELLGSLTSDKPSEIFRTGWSEHDQFLAIPPNTPATITIGVSMEPMDTIRNLQQQSSQVNNATPITGGGTASRRPMVAQKIAQDLYNFMQSFDTGESSNKGNMVVPTNIFERWWKRFEAKSKRDPNFFLKSGD